MYIVVFFSIDIDIDIDIVLSTPILFHNKKIIIMDRCIFGMNGMEFQPNFTLPDFVVSPIVSRNHTSCFVISHLLPTLTSVLLTMVVIRFNLLTISAILVGMWEDGRYHE